jgi:hypothetical protein
MSTIETKNARISSTMLGIEDHGIMSFSICLDYGGSGQCAGGYALDEPIKDKNGKFIRRIGSAAGTQLIMEIMRVVGVSSWEKLPNMNVRVRANFGKVYAIGNLLEDRWLDFGAFFEQAHNSRVTQGAKRTHGKATS